MKSSRRLSQIKAAVLLVAVLFACAAIADIPAKTPLYGIQAGADLKSIEATLGKPSMKIPFDDGWTATVYQLHGHNLIIETAANDSMHVVAVQIRVSQSTRKGTSWYQPRGLVGFSP